MPFWFSQVIAVLSAKGGERVVENPQILPQVANMVRRTKVCWYINPDVE